MLGYRKTSGNVISDISELQGLDVEVYRNLNKGCLSIRCKGYVVAHLESITLEDVRFKVSASGRARVIREKRKNVHAVICGRVASLEGTLQPHHIKVRYNPYIRGEFFRVDDNQGIQKAKQAVIGSSGIGILA